MTLQPTKLGASAIEITDDDGRPVATIYAQSAGIEIICQEGYSAEYSHSRSERIEHLGITFTRHRTKGEIDAKE